MPAILSPQLDEDIKSFIEDAVLNKHIKKLSAIIKTNISTFVAMKVMAIFIKSDYEHNYGEVTTVQLRIGLGDYIHRIYPSRDFIDIHIREQVGNAKPVQRTYVAFLNIKSVPMHVGSGNNNLDINTLNNSDFLDIEFQLIDKDFYTMKNTYASGVFSNMTPTTLIKAQFSRYSEGTSIEGVEMLPADQKYPRTHLFIPEGVSLALLPTFIQLHMGGLYNHGVGTYVASFNGKKNWYVYPLYKMDLFKDSKHRAVFIIASENTYTGLENTWMVQGGIIKILITGTRKYQDNGVTTSENEGMGFKAANASAFMKKPVNLSTDSPVGVGLELGRVEQINVGKRVNNRPSSGGLVTDNLYKERSLLSHRNKGTFLVNWENSNPDLIYPNMPCKILMIIGGKLTSMHGVISAIQSNTIMMGNSVLSETYTTTSVVNITVPNIDTAKLSTSLLTGAPVEGRM